MKAMGSVTRYRVTEPGRGASTGSAELVLAGTEGIPVQADPRAVALAALERMRAMLGSGTKRERRSGAASPPAAAPPSAAGREDTVTVTVRPRDGALEVRVEWRHP